MPFLGGKQGFPIKNKERKGETNKKNKKQNKKERKKTRKTKKYSKMSFSIINQIFPF